uniref:Uncharacterized protein n=1 Tax=Anopheles quadriannulatus TaxID=34691 RepID=A0A182XTG7_ANOQN
MFRFLMHRLVVGVDFVRHGMCEESWSGIHTVRSSVFCVVLCMNPAKGSNRRQRAKQV